MKSGPSASMILSGLNLSTYPELDHHILNWIISYHLHLSLCTLCHFCRARYFFTCHFGCSFTSVSLKGSSPDQVCAKQLSVSPSYIFFTFIFLGFITIHKKVLKIYYIISNWNIDSINSESSFDLFSDIPLGQCT